MDKEELDNLVKELYELIQVAEGEWTISRDTADRLNAGIKKWIEDES